MSDKNRYEINESIWKLKSKCFFIITEGCGMTEDQMIEFKAGNLSCLTFARDIFKRGEEDREYFGWMLELLHKARWNEFPQSNCHRVVNSLYEIRKSVIEENEFVQRKLITYLKATNPDDLLINATVKYPQFKDESKKLKLFLLDIVNGENEPVNTIIGKQGKFIA